MKMNLYKRYVDDSNQVAEVPPNGSYYDMNVGKVLFNEEEIGVNEQDDARLARLLKDIAEVQEGIKMEAEFPSNDRSGKMAILDMSVWMDSDNNIVYEHY